MQIFYLIRHGETDWNKQGLLQGHTDIELNGLGLKQAQQLQLFLQSLRVDQVISSDLKRALKTAQVSMPERVIEQDPRLREVYLGQAEGSDRHKMRETYGDELIDQWISEKPEHFKAHFPQGESRRQGVDRLKSSLQEWLSKEKGPLAFFSHGLLIRSFAQEVLGRNHENLRAPNCSVFEFSWDQKNFKLRQIFWTDHSE